MSNLTQKVAVIGLGSMGLGIAETLLRRGAQVRGYDSSTDACGRFSAAGGEIGSSAADAGTGCEVVLSVVVNASQTEAVLFGENGVAEIMAPGSVFVSSATMAPERARALAAKLSEFGILYLDAPTSGGAKRAASGELTVMASGPPAAFATAGQVLEAISTKLYRLGDEAGIGASFKIINQLLAGVHIAVACEAITLAAKMGLDLARVHEVILGSAGNSWMFENRVPHILSGDYRPLSAVEIFVKDLGIVQDIARAERYSAPIAAAALQMYLATAGAGMGNDDDASVARLYAQISGVVLPQGTRGAN